MAQKAPTNDRDTDTPKTAPVKAPGAATAAQLRDRIDRGGAGDKVAFSDPAAAPLGTDDEAAGTPPSATQVAQATEAETGRAAEASRKPSPADLQDGRLRRGALLITALAIILLVALMVSGGG